MPNSENLKEPWSKGTSGNPNGRPKGAKSLKKILNQFLDISAPSQFDNVKDHLGIIGSITYREVIAAALIMKAASGNLQAIHEIMNRIDGPVSANNAEIQEAIDVSVKIYSGDMKLQQMADAKAKLTKLISGGSYNEPEENDDY